MAYPQNIYRNKAVVLLHKYCGMTWYQIEKAFGGKNKRNLMVIFERDKDKYFLPNEKIIKPKKV